MVIVLFLLVFGCFVLFILRGYCGEVLVRMLLFLRVIGGEVVILWGVGGKFLLIISFILRGVGGEFLFFVLFIFWVVIEEDVLVILFVLWEDDNVDLVLVLFFFGGGDGVILLILKI